MGVERVRPIRFDPINGILAANDESAGLGENSGEDQATATTSPVIWSSFSTLKVLVRSSL